jgi:hypothetical protein
MDALHQGAGKQDKAVRQILFYPCKQILFLRAFPFNFFIQGKVKEI